MEKKLFERLMESAREMVAIEKGEIEVPPHRIHIHKIPNVKAIRTQHQMKQAEFASLFRRKPKPCTVMGNRQTNPKWCGTEIACDY